MAEVKEGSPAARLWGLLDDIDTLSDMIKPNDLKGYQAFYSQALRRAEKRHEVFFADGYKLWTEQPKGTIKTAAPSPGSTPPHGAVAGT